MICEKCGFEYTGDTCPVCAAEEASKSVAVKKSWTGLGLAGMICGIVALLALVGGLPAAAGQLIAMFAAPYLIVTALTGQIIGLVPAIVGAILSSIGKKKLESDKFAKIGRILSTLAIIFRTLIIALFFALFAVAIIIYVLGILLSPGLYEGIADFISEIFREIGYLFE